MATSNSTKDYMPPQNRAFTPQQQIDALWRLVGQLWGKVNTINATVSNLSDSVRGLSSKRIVELIREVQTEATAEDPMYQSLIDDAGSGVTYIGEAVQGAAQNSASWRILKITTSSGDSTVLLSANYNTFGDNWTNRASVSYS
jgi:hypothetical protein